MGIKTYKGEEHGSSPRNIGYTAQYRLPCAETSALASGL